MLLSIPRESSYITTTFPYHRQRAHRGIQTHKNKKKEKPESCRAVNVSPHSVYLLIDLIDRGLCARMSVCGLCAWVTAATVCRGNKKKEAVRGEAREEPTTKPFQWKSEASGWLAVCRMAHASGKWCHCFAWHLSPVLSWVSLACCNKLAEDYDVESWDVTNRWGRVTSAKGGTQTMGNPGGVCVLTF